MRYDESVVAAAEAFYEARREEFRAYESEENWAENMTRAHAASQDAEDVLFAAIAAHRCEADWWSRPADPDGQG